MPFEARLICLRVNLPFNMRLLSPQTHFFFFPPRLPFGPIISEDGTTLARLELAAMLRAIWRLWARSRL